MVLTMRRHRQWENTVILEQTNSTEQLKQRKTGLVNGSWEEEREGEGEESNPTQRTKTLLI